MKLSMVLARSFDNVIGVDGKLPWHCPADLLNFKKITSRPNTAVVMGRNTWNSLPVRPLPGRLNIIITTQPDKMIPFEVIKTQTEYGVSESPVALVSPSIQECIDWCRAKGTFEELMFIGGAQIYEAVKDIVDEVHLTEMDLIVGDVEGEVTTFDHSFIYALWPDQENSDWNVLEQWPCYESETGKELFEYLHLVRK